MPTVRVGEVELFYTDDGQGGHGRALAWPGGGHWLHQERPDDFNGLLMDWLAGVSS